MTVAKRQKKKKKYFTPAEANAMLPLLRSILRDVTALAHELQDLQERFQHAKEGETVVSPELRVQLDAMESEFEQGKERMHEYLKEIENLGIELKDPFTGLVDFRAMLNGREVYLCWRMDEPEVAHWHDLEKGFSGRQKLMTPAAFNWQGKSDPMYTLSFFLAVFLVVSVIFLFIHLLMGKVIRPAHPEADKLTIYECGEPSIGSAWIQFDLRYYVVALLFVIFDVEVAFFFPWAITFGKANELARAGLSDEKRAAISKQVQLASLPATDGSRGDLAPIPKETASNFAWVAMVDIAVFFGVLLVGFAYLWKRGDIDWVKTVAAERVGESTQPAPLLPKPSPGRTLAGAGQQ